MASNIVADSKTPPTNPSLSTNPLMATDHGSNSTPSMDDQNCNHSNPYYLLPSNNSVVSVSQPLTSLENYLSWSRVVFLSLSGKNKFGFLNGQISMYDCRHRILSAFNLHARSRKFQKYYIFSIGP